MTDYVTLMGVEKVESAGYTMRSAADQMQRAASSIDESLARHQRFLDDWLTRLEAALEKAQPASE